MVLVIPMHELMVLSILQQKFVILVISMHELIILSILQLELMVLVNVQQELVVLVNMMVGWWFWRMCSRSWFFW